MTKAMSMIMIVKMMIRMIRMITRMKIMDGTDGKLCMAQLSTFGILHFPVFVNNVTNSTSFHFGK